MHTGPHPNVRYEITYTSAQMPFIIQSSNKITKRTHTTNAQPNIA